MSLTGAEILWRKLAIDTFWRLLLGWIGWSGSDDWENCLIRRVVNAREIDEAISKTGSIHGLEGIRGSAEIQVNIVSFRGFLSRPSEKGKA